MIEPLNTLQRISYPQNQIKDSVQKANPDSVSEQERSVSMGFYPNSQIPAVVDEEKSGLGEFDQKENGKDKKKFDTYECETCKNRKYQDGSDDPGVSFKTATKLSPEKAATAVRSHENEHVTREQAKAEREDRKVVSQNVSYHSAICPECGTVYVSGGTTRTVTKGEVEKTYGLNQNENKSGEKMDLIA